MKFRYDRLITLREKMEISRAEAARKLNMSAMGYGRYEKGEREPSFQTVSYIAQIMGTTTDYLYGISENADADYIIVEKSSEPELFSLIEEYKKDTKIAERMLAYFQKIDSDRI